MKTILSKKTGYHNVKIVDDGNIRHLYFGEGMAKEQSAVSLDISSQHVYDYSYIISKIIERVRPQRTLMIGLGGGILAREIEKYSGLDIIEIDPEIPIIAQEYFSYYPMLNTKIHIGDAWDVVDTLQGPYDLIIMDAFNTNYTPYRLMSEEFLFKLMKLSADNYGILINSCNAMPIFKNQLATIFHIFGDYVWEIKGRNNTSSSILCIFEKFQKMDMTEYNDDSYRLHFKYDTKDVISIRDNGETK